MAKNHTKPDYALFLGLGFVVALFVILLVVSCEGLPTPQPSPLVQVFDASVNVYTFEGQPKQNPIVGAEINGELGRWHTNAVGYVNVALPSGHSTCLRASAVGRVPFSACRVVTHDGEYWTFYLMSENN